MRSPRIGHFGKSVAGQIDETHAVPKLKEVYELGPAGGFAGPRELTPVDYDVDSTRFSRVRAPCHGDLPAVVRQELLWRVGAQNEFCIWVLRHGIWPRSIVYNPGPAAFSEPTSIV